MNEPFFPGYALSESAGHADAYDQGADILAEIARQHTSVGPFLQMAIDVCRHHHERWDGSG